jgi:hypothetical protein
LILFFKFDRERNPLKDLPVNLADKVIRPSGKLITPVKETTFYPAQFPILLTARYQGKTITQASELLGIPANQFIRLLDGQWRPSKEICRRMGLKVVYAIGDDPSRVF